MPELPEVETTCRVIRPLVMGRRIRGFAATVERLRKPLDVEGLNRELAGATVKELRRRAKYLLLELTGRRGLLLHLGMTGSLSWVRKEVPLEPHDRFAIHFAGGRELRLHDPRRFGLVERVTLESAGALPAALDHLGPEPLGEEFDGEYLFRLSRGRRTPVKVFVMDQVVVVGVGNIYASEALFRAGIRPGRAAGRVTRSEYGRIAAEIVAVLRESITAGGTTISDYHADGARGRFVDRLAVYGREGESCGKRGCGGVVARQVHGGRSSFYCPRCQR